jgi:hypothetical protein
MQKRKGAARAASTLAVAGLALAAWAGVAAAVSGGGFNPDQQDCPWNGDAWNAAPNDVPPGCHSATVNVETGNTTNGDPNSDNTRFAEAGLDALPNNPGNPSFGYEEYVGDPGTPDSPHSGCLAVSTAGVGPGCSGNGAGAGFSASWDYYAVYCPAVSMLPAGILPSPPAQTVPDPTGVFGPAMTPTLYQCANPAPAMPVTITPQQGSQSALQDIATQGLLVYIGANDNLDNGEHDGFSGLNNTGGAINGPSDGGALILSLTPQGLMDSPSATNPEGLVNASEGECADSICADATTQQQTMYYGCVPAGSSPPNDPQNNWSDVQCTPGTPGSTEVYKNDTPASTTEAYGCNAGDQSTEQACSQNQDGSPNLGGANAYRASTPSQVNAEPGIQTYQDPDPQRSPALPFATPGLYVGTCGVYADLNSGDGAPGVLDFLTQGAVNPDQNGYLVPTTCG